MSSDKAGGSVGRAENAAAVRCERLPWLRADHLTRLLGQGVQNPWAELSPHSEKLSRPAFPQRCRDSSRPRTHGKNKCCWREFPQPESGHRPRSRHHAHGRHRSARAARRETERTREQATVSSSLRCCEWILALPYGHWRAYVMPSLAGPEASRSELLFDDKP